MNSSAVTDNVTHRRTDERYAGALAAAAWLAARGLNVPVGFGWDVAIALDVLDQPASPTVTSAIGTRFHIWIGANEWGFRFSHLGKVSWIRVTDLPFVHERDDHGLLGRVPPLRDLGSLVHSLEARHDLSFHRKHASIRTNLRGVENTIRIWLAAAI